MTSINRFKALSFVPVILMASSPALVPPIFGRTHHKFGFFVLHFPARFPSVMASFPLAPTHRRFLGVDSISAKYTRTGSPVNAEKTRVFRCEARSAKFGRTFASALLQSLAESWQQKVDDKRTIGAQTGANNAPKSGLLNSASARDQWSQLGGK